MPQSYGNAKCGQIIVIIIKKGGYDCVDDATAIGQIAQMYVRKQKIFTEMKVYPYVKDEHLRLDYL